MVAREKPNIGEGRKEGQHGEPFLPLALPRALCTLFKKTQSTPIAAFSSHRSAAQKSAPYIAII